MTQEGPLEGGEGQAADAQVDIQAEGGCVLEGRNKEFGNHWGGGKGGGRGEKGGERGEKGGEGGRRREKPLTFFCGHMMRAIKNSGNGIGEGGGGGGRRGEGGRALPSFSATCCDPSEIPVILGIACTV
jgi:hypothetical protein